ncbi:MAG: hypothetical protein KIT24_05540 [Phycisphaeraceae bacterium]|nr:hypothetical protein [Phycisphaeraceae bacterium]
MQAKRLLIWTLVTVFVLAIASFMVTYTVRFTEAAVVTTFGQAGEDAQAKQAGLHWKLPYPFQSVTKYDTRMRYVQTKLETQQTRDNKQIILEAYCLWRVKDPMRFFKRFSIAGERAADHYREAETRLNGMLRSAMSSTSAYSLGELFPSSGQTSQLDRLESDILAAMTRSTDLTAEGAQRLDDFGIEIVQVGITRIQFPSDTTTAVIERMSASRKKLVTEIEEQGKAEADRITGGARANADRIMAFAEQRGQEIRAQGDRDSAQYLALMSANPELAKFLRHLDTMRETLAGKVTLILSDQTPGLQLVNPRALRNLVPGQIPAMTTQTEPANEGGNSGGAR